MVKRCRLVVLRMTLTLWASLVTIQGVGFQGGETASSDQFDVGSHIELTLDSDRFVICPNVEGETGDGLTT